MAKKMPGWAWGLVALGVLVVLAPLCLVVAGAAAGFMAFDRATDERDRAMEAQQRAMEEERRAAEAREAAMAREEAARAASEQERARQEALRQAEEAAQGTGPDVEGEAPGAGRGMDRGGPRSNDPLAGLEGL